MADCTVATYTLLSDGLIWVKNRSYVWWLGFTYKEIEGKGKEQSPGRIYVNFSKDPNMDKPGNYKVLMTDYTGYSVVYNC